MRRPRYPTAVVASMTLLALVHCGEVHEHGEQLPVGLDYSSAIALERTLQIDRLDRKTDLPSLLKLHGLALDRKRRRLYVTGTLTPRIGVIDADSQQIVDTIEIGVHGYISKHLLVNSETGMIYMLALEPHQLYRVDPERKTLSKPIALDQLASFAVDEQADSVYVSASQEVRIYDATLQQVGTIAAAGGGDLAIDAAARRLHLLGRSDVRTFDLDSKEQIATHSLPAGAQPRFISATGPTIVVSCGQQRRVVMIDGETGQSTILETEHNAGSVSLHQGSVYVSTGYPYSAGDMPDEDGAYGFVEIFDAETGSKLGQIRTGLQGAMAALDPQTNSLYVANTGESTVKQFDLSSGESLVTIDTATTIEDLVVRPSDGALLMRNRLGGGNSILAYLDGQVSTISDRANWPTKMLLDAEAGLVHVLSHYQSKVVSFDADDPGQSHEIALGEQGLRCDGLSNMALDATRQRLYAILPELGKVVVLDIEQRRKLKTIEIAGLARDGAEIVGGAQIALNARAGRVYVLAAKQHTLHVYDAKMQHLHDVTLPDDYLGASQQVPLNAMLSDDLMGRLHVGVMVLGVDGKKRLARLTEGARVVGVDPWGERLYAFESGVDPQAARTGEKVKVERLIELDRETLTVKRRYETSSFAFVPSTVAFDFERGKAYIAHMEAGTLDVLKIGTPN